MYHRGRSVEAPTPYFDAENAEGDFVQSCSRPMVGVATAFATGLTSGLAKMLYSAFANEPDSSLAQHIDTDIHAGILLGLSSARRLAGEGFRVNCRDNAPDYPLVEVMHDLKPEQKTKAVHTPAADIGAGSSWSILEDVIGDPAEIAYYIVKDGSSKALSQAPIARFGKLMTADRHEIESFCAIANLVQEYLMSPSAGPLCIGVFGPPGSGKSFGVKQVIEKAAEGRRPVKRLEFNLSQFADYSDLLDAFQLIRNGALSGKVPLVLFDEFDARFGTKLGWLRYFLAPMQDGEFLDHGRMHPLGQAIFAFIGGTSSTFERFTEGRQFSLF